MAISVVFCSLPPFGCQPIFYCRQRITGWQCQLAARAAGGRAARERDRDDAERHEIQLQEWLQDPVKVLEGGLENENGDGMGDGDHGGGARVVYTIEHEVRSTLHPGFSCRSWVV